MPCMELFEKQSAEYRDSVLPRKVSRLVSRLEGLGAVPSLIASFPSPFYFPRLTCFARLLQVVARVSVEAGTSFGWDRYTGWGGKHIGIDSFGASAPAPILYEKFGITKAHVIKAAKECIAAAKKH